MAVKLIKMRRLTPNPPENLTEIDVHPDTVTSHEAVGWFVAPEESEKQVEEIVVPEELKGKLPEDFPGHAALAEAGINTYAQLRKAGDVTEVPGIGKATAGKIADTLATTEEGKNE